MKATAQRAVTITIELNETEACWLIANMQNPLHGVQPDHEIDNDRACRIELFTALSQVLAAQDGEN